MEAPQFIDIDPAQIRADIKADYEDLTGRTLQPAQVEQLLVDAFAYREYLLRTQIQDAAVQNLVQFARAPYLDFLGQLVGVRRLGESAATCSVKLTFVTGHGALTVPSGIRIQSLDGLAVFSLNNDVTIDAQTSDATASFTCLSTGTIGNDYNPGDVSIILDPQPYLLFVANADKTVGGADQESDDDLRKRIMLAPQSFSNAGSYGAYKFFAKSANPAIADVGITSPVPGQVNIYPLLQNGELPNQTVLAEVADACNDDKIRPLTDTVIVDAPTEKDYDIEVDLTVLTGEIDSDAIDQVTTNLKAYADSRHSGLGRDVVIEKIIGESMKVGSVYAVKVNSPIETLIVDDNEVAKCGTITVNVTSHSDE